MVRVGVMGAGAIGCYVGGRLAASGEAQVTLIGRQWLRDAVREHGLTVRAFDEDATTIPGSALRLETEPSALADCDVVLCCVKSAQTAAVGEILARVLSPDAIVASFQNGVRNPDVLRARLGDRAVVASIVGFNVVMGDGAVFHQTTSGPITVERVDNPNWQTALDAMASQALEIEELDEIASQQWTKLLLNLNNAVSALSGAPTRQLVLDAGYRKIVRAVMAEGLRVLRAAKIRPAALGGIPVSVTLQVMRMPTPIVRLFAGRQIKIDPEARSSMWQDLKRGRATEVDYLNGEIVELAERTGAHAPLNQRIVELIREAEASASGSSELDADRLWSKLAAP